MEVELLPPGLDPGFRKQRSPEDNISRGKAWGEGTPKGDWVRNQDYSPCWPEVFLSICLLGLDHYASGCLVSLWGAAHGTGQSGLLTSLGFDEANPLRKCKASPLGWACELVYIPPPPLHQTLPAHEQLAMASPHLQLLRLGARKLLSLLTCSERSTYL